MKKVFVFLSFLIGLQSLGQSKPATTAAVDTAFTDYDALFSELDILLDSITRPRSFTMFNVGIENTSFQTKDASPTSIKKWMYSPSLTYYDKSGFGIVGEYSFVNDGQRLNPFQLSLTGSYDYIKNRKFMTGLSFGHFFTNPDFNYYSSPLENVAAAYFSYRGSKLKPSVTFQYGWGSQDVTEEPKLPIGDSRTGSASNINSKNVSDFNVTTSVRYNFYLLNQLSRKDYLKFTPQLSFTSGTQQFGSSQVNTIYSGRGRSGKTPIIRTENTVVNESLPFQPLSIAAFLKTEYSKGKFFVQPQLGFDYYFPATTNQFTTAFIVNAGLVF